MSYENGDLFSLTDSAIFDSHLMASAIFWIQIRKIRVIENSISRRNWFLKLELKSIRVVHCVWLWPKTPIFPMKFPAKAEWGPSRRARAKTNTSRDQWNGIRWGTLQIFTFHISQKNHSNFYLFKFPEYRTILLRPLQLIAIHDCRDA